MVSLYTIIPIQEATINITDRIQDPILHLSKQDISDILQVMLNNMYFYFRDQVFYQSEGLPMGSSISGILAIIFMDRLETITLSSHLMISPYKRYVDDIYLQTTNEETADHFRHIINNVHPNLKFEGACHYHYSTSKSPYSRMATALLNSTKNRYSSTINQLFPPNPNSTSFATNGNASRADAPHMYLQHNT